MTRLLLVDDDDGVRVTLAANLELEGFEVVEASSAEAALGYVGDAAFDVVLSDVRMGGMNGVDMLIRMRREHPKLPVILMTAFSSDDLLHQAYQSGAFTVLPKPFLLDRAVTTLHRATRRPRVLVVDAAKADADALAQAIGRSGSSTHAVYDEATALDEVRSGNYDVVVTGGSNIATEARTIDPTIGVIAATRKPVDPAKVIESIAIARAQAPSDRARRSL